MCVRECVCGLGSVFIHGQVISYNDTVTIKNMYDNEKS